jgi:hypothetical protein
LEIGEGAFPFGLQARGDQIINPSRVHVSDSVLLAFTVPTHALIEGVLLGLDGGEEIRDVGQLPWYVEHQLPRGVADHARQSIMA